MLRCIDSDESPILVAMSAPDDRRLAERALDELGLEAEWCAAGVETMRELCRSPRGYSAVIVGDRVGDFSGWTLCGVARDAGVAAPLLLLTAEETRMSALRAALLGVSVLWRPTSPRRFARALAGMLPRRPCAVRATTLPAAGWPGSPPGR